MQLDDDEVDPDVDHPLARALARSLDDLYEHALLVCGGNADHAAQVHIDVILVAVDLVMRRAQSRTRKHF